MGMSNIELFLNFIKGDKRNNIQVSRLDFPLLRYTESLRQRLRMLTILRNEILELTQKDISEYKVTLDTGFGYDEFGGLLIIRYEAFLNQIYNITENISRINLFLFDSIKNPPQKFSRQKKQIRSGKLKLHPFYDEIIKNKIGWYEEVHTIRSNANHFLAGFRVFGRDESGEPVLEYINYNLSESHVTNNEFKIKRNIVNDVIYFYRNTLEFLDEISQIYIELMDKDVQCAITFPYDDRIEFREISFNEYISGGEGTLVQYPIPLKKRGN